MTTADRIKKLCKSHGISVRRLELDCDFSNGYIHNLKDNAMRADKLQKIADYFGVTVEYLQTGKQSKYYTSDGVAEYAQALFDNPDIRVLFDAAKDSKAEDIQMAAELLKRLKRTNIDG